MSGDPGDHSGIAWTDDSADIWYAGAATCNNVVYVYCAEYVP